MNLGFLVDLTFDCFSILCFGLFSWKNRGEKSYLCEFFKAARFIENWSFDERAWLL